jgi:peptide-methionine (R)-S-oxide reductase
MNTIKKNFQRAAQVNPLTKRRAFLWKSLGAIFAGVSVGKTIAAPSAPAVAKEVSIEKFSASGKSEGVTKARKVVKTDQEWRNQLTGPAFKVARQDGTEPPFSGKYANNHADGLYRCICCDTALFDSKTKYESGTGWPSFWQSISQTNVLKSSDRSFGMQRDAISCALCDAHLGHVFDDGPKPTGLRYCMNSVSLNFAPRA